MASTVSDKKVFNINAHSHFSLTGQTNLTAWPTACIPRSCQHRINWQLISIAMNRVNVDFIKTSPCDFHPHWWGKHWLKVSRSPWWFYVLLKSGWQLPYFIFYIKQVIIISWITQSGYETGRFQLLITALIELVLPEYNWKLLSKLYRLLLKFLKKKKILSH